MSQNAVQLNDKDLSELARDLWDGGVSMEAEALEADLFVYVD